MLLLLLIKVIMLLVKYFANDCEAETLDKGTQERWQP